MLTFRATLSACERMTFILRRRQPTHKLTFSPPQQRSRLPPAPIAPSAPRHRQQNPSECACQITHRPLGPVCHITPDGSHLVKKVLGVYCRDIGTFSAWRRRLSRNAGDEHLRLNGSTCAHHACVLRMRKVRAPCTRRVGAGYMRALDECTRCMQSTRPTCACTSYMRSSCALHPCG